MLDITDVKPLEYIYCGLPTNYSPHIRLPSHLTGPCTHCGLRVNNPHVARCPKYSNSVGQTALISPGLTKRVIIHLFVGLSASHFGNRMICTYFSL